MFIVTRKSPAVTVVNYHTQRRVRTPAGREQTVDAPPDKRHAASNRVTLLSLDVHSAKCLDFPKPWIWGSQPSIYGHEMTCTSTKSPRVFSLAFETVHDRKKGAFFSTEGANAAVAAEERTSVPEAQHKATNGTSGSFYLQEFGITRSVTSSHLWYP
ncbi:hypothetical protein EVAR_41000_1 [Eumeta japonica]|uniref:Uncharacterized protein n=1 Tax=Eumeta variegata TaxID=151549 RepID=A0A4C1XG75_EUMVA|nr:hypothetical protein EVAR_41000_1 [Eumeta japonica]